LKNWKITRCVAAGATRVVSFNFPQPSVDLHRSRAFRRSQRLVQPLPYAIVRAVSSPDVQRVPGRTGVLLRVARRRPVLPRAVVSA
jgi:hypothetical protein